MPLHVAVVSGSRADFGPLQPLIAGIQADERLRLSLIVCAVADPDEAQRQMAAVADAGWTIDEAITTGGIAEPLPMTAQAARALDGVADALRRRSPDVVVLLGDRFEILASAVAAHLLRVPIIHLSGGDETLGSLDDAMRHAISRLASMHLPTNEESAGRLLALGVPAERIVVVGSTALDALLAFAPPTRLELAAMLGAELGDRIITVTYHPATQADEPPASSFRELVAGIRSASSDATIVVTSANADEGGREIDAVAREIASTDPMVILVPSLGAERYWALLHHSDVVVGNSSSALIEAPVVGVPVVDVGERQESRLRAASCIHVAAQRGAVTEGVIEALQRVRNPEPSPYGDGLAVTRTLDLLAGIDDPSALLIPSALRPLER